MPEGGIVMRPCRPQGGITGIITARLSQNPLQFRTFYIHFYTVIFPAAFGKALFCGQKPPRMRLYYVKIVKTGIKDEFKRVKDAKKHDRIGAG